MTSQDPGPKGPGQFRIILKKHQAPSHKHQASSTKQQAPAGLNSATIK
jgi:hypothetical protein